MTLTDEVQQDIYPAANLENTTYNGKCVIGMKTVQEDTLWSSNMDSFFLKGQSIHAISSLESDIDQDKHIAWDSTTGVSFLPVNLRLPHDENYFQFHFPQLNTTSCKTGLYKYLLEGLDKEWSAPTNSTYSQNYRNILPGYVF